jgi:deazaflavin-dependent oxidoreductase (nitroreductase family)
MLEETPYLNLTTRGRKTGLKRNVELWFAFENSKVYFLAHESSHWWKNLANNPRVEVEVSEILFEGTGRLVQDKLDHVFELFRHKYGSDQVERWYGGSRAKRRAVEIELGHVLGKRPSSKNQRLEITI